MDEQLSQLNRVPFFKPPVTHAFEALFWPRPVYEAPLILVSGRVRQLPDMPESDNARPRQDYHEIARRMEAYLVGRDSPNRERYGWVLQIGDRLKLDIAAALTVTERWRLPRAALSTSEKTAIPLAMATWLRRQTIPHVVIAHKLSSGLKKPFLRLWPLHKHFSHLICVSQAQANYAIETMGMPIEKVTFLHDKVDHLYFEPSHNESGDYILAVGNEQRDYDCLSQAVAGTGLKLVVVTSSPWSANNPTVQPDRDVTVLKDISYDRLRALYAGARLVVVPLKDVDYAAGANSLLEAMAMGKPIIASRTLGLTGYVRHDETAVQVSPGRPSDLRQAILSHWDRPDRLQELGHRARQVVVNGLNIDRYADRIADIMTETILRERLT